jgi:hypothetical protein
MILLSLAPMLDLRVQLNAAAGRAAVRTSSSHPPAFERLHLAVAKYQNRSLSAREAKKKSLFNQASVTETRRAPDAHCITLAEHSTFPPVNVHVQSTSSLPTTHDGFASVCTTNARQLW